MVWAVDLMAAEEKGDTFQTPARPPEIPGFPENFQLLIFDGFKGLNTKPTRPGIEDQEMAWCDNWMPLGEGNLRTLYDMGGILFTSGSGPSFEDDLLAETGAILLTENSQNILI